MPAELIAVFTGIVIAAGLGIQQLIKATVNRRVKTMEEDADQALKDREAARLREREADQQATLRLQAELEKAKADASDAKAIGENLTNLTAAFLKSVDTYAKEQFANREALSNNTQTVGDLAQSVDRVGTILSENTTATRKVSSRLEETSEEMQRAVSAVFNKFLTVFPTDKPVDAFFEELKRAINDAFDKACAEKVRATQETPAVNVVTVNTGAPALDELPKASGQ